MNTPFGTLQVLLVLDWTPEQEPVRGLWEAKTQLCTANAFLCCLSAATIKNACFTLLGSNQFVWCIFLSCDTVAFYHCVHGKSLFVVVFVGPCPFCCLLCFSAGWRNAYLAGGSAFRLLWCFCLCLVCVVDLPSYMTTGVNVDFISNCFFTCKDRALERDRPYQRKKIMLLFFPRPPCPALLLLPLLPLFCSSFLSLLLFVLLLTKLGSLLRSSGAH